MFAVLLPGHVDGIPNRAAERLRKEFNAKVTPPVDGKGWTVVFPRDAPVKTLEVIGPLLRDIDVQTLNLSGCRTLTSVDGLSWLTGLQTLDLNCCFALTSVDGLQGLPQLRKLDLRYCRSLTELTLHQLKSLKRVGVNQLTDDQTSALRQALPRMVIVTGTGVEL